MYIIDIKITPSPSNKRRKKKKLMIIGTAKEGKEAACLLISEIYCSPGYNSFERKRGSNRPGADGMVL